MTCIASLVSWIGALLLFTEVVLAEDTHGCYLYQKALVYEHGEAARIYYWFPKCVQGGYFQNVQCDFYGCYCAYLDTGAKIPETVENAYALYMREACPWTSQKPLDTCAMPPANYPCRKTSRKFYYNAGTNKCEESSTSCLGFDTSKACEDSCVVQVKDRCNFEQKQGTECSETETSVRWYHDEEQDKCRPFLYWGCGGNSNNYEHKWDCLKTCEENHTTELLIQVECTKYIISLPTWMVVQQEYSDVSVNKLSVEQFKEIEDDMTAIAEFPEKEPEVEDWEKYRPEHAAKNMSREELCGMKKEQGPCRALFPRWYFDKEESKCVKFIYGGCYGNENRHLTAVGCAAFCDAEVLPTQLEILEGLISSGGLIGAPGDTEKTCKKTHGGPKPIEGNGGARTLGLPGTIILGENELEFEFSDDDEE